MKNTENFNKCEIADICGGCLYQGMSYKEQLDRKNNEIVRLLDRHNIDTSIYEGLVPALGVYRYRNKMEYTFGDLEKGGDMTLGMHRKGQFMSIVTSDMCQLVPQDFNTILRAVLDFSVDRGYSFYNKKTHVGLLRNLIVRHGVKTGELLVNIVTSSENGFDEESFVGVIRGLNLENTVVGVVRTFNDSLADAVIDQGVKIMYGRDYYNETILGLRFRVSAFSFFQTNIEAVERLYSDALGFIPDIDKKTVYDLYCGTGTISQLMAGKARRVFGIELVEDAVAAARENTALNGIENCEFIAGDVRTTLQEIPEKPDVIVVDPPRVGMHDKVVDMIAGYGVDNILYVSCNPKTLCLNLEKFREYGYMPVRMRSYDNFPMTKHSEAVVLITKQN